MSTNQNIKPLTIQKENNLTVGGCDIIELAKKYGTPLYIIDELTLRTTAREYINAFEGKNVRILYASKALCNIAIAKILSDEGLSFDVVSSGEIYTLIKAGVDLSQILFNGNNKTIDELEYALDKGVGRFSVDNFYEAEVLNNLCKNKSITADILLRITPGIECHTHDYIQTGQTDSKFGFDISQLDEIIMLLRTKYKNLSLRGLHAHIGSQIFELKSFEDEIDILIKLSSEIRKKHDIILTELNIGGGNGIKYTEKDFPPSTEQFANTINIALEKALKKYDFPIPIIYIEPGRSMISPSGITIYTIGSSKQVPNGKKYVAVDGGMADNPRHALYQAEYSAEVANNTSSKKTEVVTIVGKYCESGDVLIDNIELPITTPGEILCVYNTGAYNYSMASNYNKSQKLAMVLVNNSQSDIIVYRESLDDLVAKECIPNRLKNNVL